MNSVPVNLQYTIAIHSVFLNHKTVDSVLTVFISFKVIQTECVISSVDSGIPYHNSV